MTDLKKLHCYKPNQKTSKHFSYRAAERGYFSKNEREHRVLENLVKASIEIGVKEDPAMGVAWWDEIVAATDKKDEYIVPAKTLELISKGKDPHFIPGPHGHVRPDGQPFLLRRDGGHLYVLGLEIDRCTEPLTTTKDRRNIEEKLENYHWLFGKDHGVRRITKHYGFDNCVVLFVTLRESRKQSMIRFWHDKYGPAKYMLFTTWKDWFNELSYPPADGTMLNRFYQRAGKPDYNLATLGA